MHFDEASDDTPSFDAATGRNQPFRRIPFEQDDDPPRREGLPPAFRMRHGRHYVEQLMGDEPVQTVRHLSVGDIEALPGETDTSALEASIGKHGVLLPLLVARAGTRYVVIDGAARLRAAVALGLDSVPCIVHGAPAESAEELRGELIAKSGDAPQPSEDGWSVNGAVFGELKASFGFASSLLDALTRAGHDRLRTSMLVDLLGTELRKASALVASAEAATTGTAAGNGDCRSAIEAAVSDVAAEARLRDVAVRLLPGTPCPASIDQNVLKATMSGLLQALLALGGAGQRLTVGIASTSVRPAAIVEMSIECRPLTAEQVRRFFDRTWAEHPSGQSGALMLAAAEQTAKVHGGRVSVRSTSAAGCVVTFVLPHPPSATGR